MVAQTKSLLPAACSLLPAAPSFENGIRMPWALSCQVCCQPQHHQPRTLSEATRGSAGLYGHGLRPVLAMICPDDALAPGHTTLAWAVRLATHAPSVPAPQSTPSWPSRLLTGARPGSQPSACTCSPCPSLNHLSVALANGHCLPSSVCFCFCFLGAASG